MNARRCVALLTVSGVVLGASLAWRPTPAGAGEPNRVLIVSAPRLTWRDISREATPNLAAFVDTAAIASMSVRTIGPRTTLAEGYATISAGNRATVVEEFAGLAVDQEADLDAAADLARRTGVPGSAGANAVFHSAFATVEAANRKLRYGSESGALGEAVGGANTAVIAQADSPDPLGEIVSRREAALALVDRSGSSSGRVSGLLRDDRKAAYGVALDPSVVLEAVREQVPRRRVTLVELSDLERADLERSVSLPDAAAGPRIWRRAVESSDKLFGELLDAVPKKITVLLVAPAAPRAREQLTVFALRDVGTEPGRARSGTTRRAGYVTLPDIGPSVLGLLRGQIPDEMVGTAITSDGSGSRGSRLHEFTRASQRTTFRDRATGPAIATFVVLQVLIYLATGIAMLMRRHRVVRVLAVLALGILAIPPLGFLAGGLPADRLGVVGFTVALMATGFAVGAAAAALFRSRSPLVAPLILVAASLAVQLFDIVSGGRLQLNTVFGYSPVVAGRFAGFGNSAFAIVAATTIVTVSGVFGIAGARRRAAALAVSSALLVTVIALDGLPSFGSDVGGVLTTVPAFLVLMLLLAGRRVGWSRIALAVFGAIGALGVFAAIDVLRPPSQRTHLGRLVARVSHDPAALGDVLARKAAANVNILTSSIWTLILPAAIALLVVLLWRSHGYLRTLQDDVPILRPALVAGVVAGILGFALNDSGVAVPAMMLGVFLPYVTWLLGVTRAADRERPTRVTQ